MREDVGVTVGRERDGTHLGWLYLHATTQPLADLLGNLLRQNEGQERMATDRHGIGDQLFRPCPVQRRIEVQVATGRKAKRNRWVRRHGRKKKAGQPEGEGGDDPSL